MQEQDMIQEYSNGRQWAEVKTAQPIGQYSAPGKLIYVIAASVKSDGALRRLDQNDI
jgi:hypothetical protein